MAKVANVDTVREALAPRYRVERELGRGGMAAVYLARDSKHGRDVAVKVLHPELAAAVGTERFEREIALAARLQHPHIPPLLDSGEADGLLYYVMPFVAGESLRDRLEREKQLPLADALRITREIADALALAHSAGVVHRDIKPSNILLEAGHAVVADFGIAHLLNQVDGETITSSGLTVGSPGYMSPEQAGGSIEVDGRSDLYSLGCVLYEMLAGEAPYTGPTPQAIMSKQVSLPIPSVTTVRDTVPVAVDRILARLLAKVPADRYPDAGELLKALAGVEREARRSGASIAVTTPNGRRRWMAGVLALLAVALVLILNGRGGREATTEGLVPDTTRYAILPFSYSTGTLPLNEVQLLTDALARWGGVSVADQFQVNHALSLAGSSGDDLTPAAAARLAQDMGAGRFIRGDVSPIGDSIRIHAGLYAASAVGRPGALLHDHAIRLPSGMNGADSLFAELADRLLFRGRVPEGAPVAPEARSLGSRQAYQMGVEALDAWNLDAADTAFSRAAALDPDYAQAHLWLALARAWSDADPSTWRLAAERAELGFESLHLRDRGMARAVAAEARGDYGVACPLWRDLTQDQPRDFTAWYGLASCLRDDGAVVPDPRSPSGYHFRTSYREALEAYRRAFRLHSPVLASFGDSAFAPMRRLLKTSPAALRAGRAVPPDTGHFGAYPGWEGDTLSLVPWPLADVSNLTAPRPREPATRHQREIFLDIARAWAMESPRSAAAREALGLALGMLGDATALDTLGTARRLARTDADRLRLATLEVWLRLKRALPDDPAGLEAARRQADSALRESESAPAEAASHLASLAAVLGRSGLASRLSRRAAAEGFIHAPASLAGDASAFLAFASLGGPGDSLTALEREIAAILERRRGEPGTAAVRREWLARPVSLAFPDWVPPDLGALAGHNDYLIDMQAALITGDTAAVRAILGEIERFRADNSAAGVTVDALYPEARILIAMGDTASATSRLREFLWSLTEAPPDAFIDVARAGTLMRAVVLAADLAARRGDTAQARLWAAAVVNLWAGADPFLEPVVTRMRSRLENTQQEGLP